MAYVFYPGCSLQASSRHYLDSLRAVCRALDVEMEDLDDWNCCGATAYMSVAELRAFALSARNLALAEQAGGSDLVTACNGCYVVLNKTNKYLGEDPKLRAKVDDALAAGGLTYRGTVKVRHALDVFVNDVGLEAIRRQVRASLSGLKLAPYYGCQIGRPYDDFDDAEYPMTLDYLLQALEAEVVPYPLKVRCCGGMLMSTNQPVALKLVRDLLECARQASADAIVVTCPLCYVNLDGYQDKVANAYGVNYDLPILFFTQLMAIALGLPTEAACLDAAIVSPQRALAAHL